MTTIHFDYDPEYIPPMPVLVRQIGEDKWEDGEAIIHSRVSQGETGNIDITVETYYGTGAGLAWKFVVHHDGYYQTIARQTWAKDTTISDGVWTLRNICAPYII